MQTSSPPAARVGTVDSGLVFPAGSHLLRAGRGALTPGTLRCSGHYHPRMVSCLNCSLSQGHVFAAEPGRPRRKAEHLALSVLHSLAQTGPVRGSQSSSLGPSALLLHVLGRSWEIWKQGLGSRGAARGRINTAPKESIRGN